MHDTRNKERERPILRCVWVSAPELQSYEQPNLLLRPDGPNGPKKPASTTLAQAIFYGSRKER